MMGSFIILCILGLVAAFPNDENPIADPLEGVLDTAVTGPLNNINDQVQDLGLPVELSSPLARNTKPQGNGECKNKGDWCFRKRECCSGSCHLIFRKCA